MPSENNKRIAKNTIMLYFRMIVTMMVSFYTTRLVLQSLGVIDYGLVNVIGSAVSMFSFLSHSLSTAASRFFNFQLGVDDRIELQRTFSMIILMYGGLSILLLILAETIGLWVLRTKLLIPPERFEAAIWFFHASVITLLISLWALPYQAMVISHENMRVYAAASIFEAFARLGIVYSMTVLHFDRLILYGFLLCLVAFLHFLIYKIVCAVNYRETKFIIYFDKVQFKTLLSFSGWNMFGTAAWASSDIFLNLLLNNYFGPVVNAARGIALQVSTGTHAFTQNFLTAARPQVVKYWAAGEKEKFFLLFRRISKTGFFLLLTIALPVIIETKFILNIWLTKVPEHAISFTQLVLITGLINSFSPPLVYAAQATGKIALFEGMGSSVRFLILPAAWIVLRLGAQAEIVLVIGFWGTAACVFARLIIFTRIANYSLKDFFAKIFYPCMIVMAVAGVVPITIRFAFNESWMRFLTVVSTSLIFTGVSVYVFGLEKVERFKLADIAISQIEKKWLQLRSKLV